jgi:hypothetical protein
MNRDDPPRGVTGGLDSFLVRRQLTRTNAGSPMRVVVVMACAWIKRRMNGEDSSVVGSCKSGRATPRLQSHGMAIAHGRK